MSKSEPYFESKKFGIIEFGENSSVDAADFEKSFSKHFFSKKKSPFYSGFIKKFGDIAFGEENNQDLKDFNPY